MESQVPLLTLGILPEPRARWQKFAFSYGVQTVLTAAALIFAISNPDVLEIPDRDYHFVNLVNNPTPVPQQPAPMRALPTPKVKLAEIIPQRPEAMRVPTELRTPKKPNPEVQAPKVQLAAKLDAIPDPKPMVPRQMVKTNVFSNGSSATPTIAANPSKVQTGGLGDPNGVPARDNPGHAVTIARLGSFDMPAGPGEGNGTGGAKGVRGVVASAGFGNGVATGDNSGRVSASRGTVRQGGFGDADVVAPATAKSKAPEAVAKTIPAEITFKPRPVYTDEGRRLKVEGEVLLEVVFTAAGQIRVQRVVQGLGHGLDESAIQAAQKIQFKPALKDGQPSDFQAVLHIVFQLAS
ncbi:MAG TPA: energy transducer TonB [Terriglobales bacterium]|nr:energy transducer TonB [Terriglobales bacterium]